MAADHIEGANHGECSCARLQRKSGTRTRTRRTRGADALLDVLFSRCVLGDAWERRWGTAGWGRDLGLDRWLRVESAGDGRDGMAGGELLAPCVMRSKVISK